MVIQNSYQVYNHAQINYIYAYEICFCSWYNAKCIMHNVPQLLFSIVQKNMLTSITGHMYRLMPERQYEVHYILHRASIIVMQSYHENLTDFNRIVMWD